MLKEQEAVYAAQAEVFPLWGRTFHGIDEAVVYLSDIMNSTWFFDSFGTWPPVKVAVWKDKNRWAGAADIPNFRILLKDGLINESVIIHELSHLMCGEDDHGQCFVNTQLKLVRGVMGFYCYAEYQQALRRTGVFSV
jgi:hypothetical protein